jgi:hypothetical protein
MMRSAERVGDTMMMVVVMMIRERKKSMRIMKMIGRRENITIKSSKNYLDYIKACAKTRSIMQKPVNTNFSSPSFNFSTEYTPNKLIITQGKNTRSY